MSDNDTYNDGGFLIKDVKDHLKGTNESVYQHFEEMILEDDLDDDNEIKGLFQPHVMQWMI